MDKYQEFLASPEYAAFVQEAAQMIRTRTGTSVKANRKLGRCVLSATREFVSGDCLWYVELLDGPFVYGGGVSSDGDSGFRGDIAEMRILIYAYDAVLVELNKPE